MNTNKLPRTVEEFLEQHIGCAGLQSLQPGWTKKIVSFSSATKQRNAKERSVSVFLNYIPTPRFTDVFTTPPTVSEQAVHNLYVSFTLRNEVRYGKFTAMEATHYFPLRALNSLLDLYHAIQENRLADYYFLTKTKQHNRSGSDCVDDSLRNLISEDFREAHREHMLFAHHYFEFPPSGNPIAMFSQFALSYDRKTDSDTVSTTPYELYCMKTPRQEVQIHEADEVPDEPAIFYEPDENGMAIVWDSNQLTETSIKITENQLLEIMEMIFQVLGSCLEQ